MLTALQPYFCQEGCSRLILDLGFYSHSYRSFRTTLQTAIPPVHNVSSHIPARILPLLVNSMTFYMLLTLHAAYVFNYGE